MSAGAQQPPDDGPASPRSPGWQIDAKPDADPDGSWWTRWTATELTSGKEMAAPFGVLAVLLLVIVLLFAALVDDEDEQIEVYRTDEWWVARHHELGIASQGKTRTAALANLREAVALHVGEAGERIDTEAEEREALRELGIDPDEVMGESTDLPEFMQ